MKSVFFQRRFIISAILSALMITFAYGTNPKLKEALTISGVKIKSYNAETNTTVIEYQVKANEAFNGTLQAGIPNSSVDKGLKSKIEALQLAKQESITKIVMVTLSENELSAVSLNISLPSAPEGTKKDYYRYFKILKSNGSLTIIDPREKTTVLNPKEEGKDLNIKTGPQNNKGIKGITGVANVQTMNYTVNISGRILIDELPNKGLYGNGVRLAFRNSSTPGDWYHPILGHTQHVHYDLLDEQGNFNFNFTFTGDLSAYNQAIVVVNTMNDASYLPVPPDGYIVWENNSYKNYFNESEGVVASINPANPNITISQNGTINKEDGSILRYMQLAREFIIQRYSGSVPFNVAPVETYKSDIDAAGRFSVSWNPQQGWNHYITIHPGYCEPSTVTHEYGHFVNFSMWGQDELQWGAANNDLQEGWAIFYSFAARNYLSRLYGDDIYVAQANDDNTEYAPFNTTPIRYGNIRYAMAGYPTRAAFGCYLWNLYDNYSGGNFEMTAYDAGDNDDVVGFSFNVFHTMQMMDGAQSSIGISGYDFAFKNEISNSSASSSVDDIFHFMFDDLAAIPSHVMKSAQITNIGLTNISSSQIRLSWSPQSYAGNPTERNAPTGYRVYKNVSGAWQQVAATNFGTNSIDIPLSGSPGQYKFTSYNSTGDGFAASEKQIFSFALNPATYVESGSGGYYKLNSTNVGSSWSGATFNGSSMTIEAVPPVGLICAGWNDGNMNPARNISVNDNISLQALYKNHLLTNSINAITSNSQRKIIQDEFDFLHLVYESGGNIYATSSYDNGANWEPELRVNQTLGGCFSPSITYNQSRQQITIAWLQDIGGTRYAVVAYSYGYGDTWTQVQTIAAPNAQQLQVSSMTASSGSPDLLVWREGTSQLKGTLRRINQSFGAVRNLRLKDYNYINGFSLGAFGRTDRWDIVWTENNSLCYSSVYDDAFLSQPIMDFGVTPVVVASGDIWENSNPSIVKTGSTLTVAWEAFDWEINDRNIRVVTITPNQPGYPSISAATVFTDNQVWASRYYTPSISSHLNNNLSLSWRNNSSILSVKRVGGTWQSVTSLGGGVDPSSSERLFNTQNASVHFRRGTTLPYSLAPSVISTGGGPMEKSAGEEIAASFAGEGIEITAASAKGTSSFILVDAKTGGAKINFEDPKTERTSRSIADIRTALKSKPFTVYGDLSLKLSFKNLGDLPPLRAVRVLLEEVNRSGATIRTIGVAKQYDGTGNKREQYTFEIPQTSNTVRILVDPVLRDDSMKVEINKWYVVKDSLRSLEKFEGDKVPERILAPAVLDLLQNYPNPFNPATTIEFTVPNNGHAKLSVFNSLGQSVATLFDGFAESGYVQKATFDGSRLASGVYFSRLEFDGKTMMKKLMLVK